MGLELLNKAVAKSPDDPRIRYHLAATLGRAGQVQRARKELQTVIDSGQKFMDPQVPERILPDLG